MIFLVLKTTFCNIVNTVVVFANELVIPVLFHNKLKHVSK